ncbi:general transcription factor IIH subunit 2 [Condylostylus longicornis]|uniref:general transcription factor IIH subunit 2 n=1 Tax=Condylostylus longicornis TaxID=2530218 RepID=UPI00244DDDD1|nr:general transcription factor IIH subunit 2 [Condylostylus longicornis]
MGDEENTKEYRWETGYEKTWEAIKEDDEGLIDSNVLKIIQKAKKRRQEQRSAQNRLGMMRHLFLILDCSEYMSEQDLKPTRFLCSLKLLEIFIEEFFDQNPISQLGLIALKGKRAEKITELGGNAKKHVQIVQGLSKLNLSGEPSIQNGVDLAIKTLKVIPAHASREILIIMGSITTCDPVDINLTIDTLKNEGIRCSVISLSAEIRACRYLTKETNGTYGAALDDFHYRNLLLAHVDPPPATQTQENSLIKMGFPHAKCDEGKDPPLTMCMCHIENVDEPSKLNSGGYHCPQCFSKYCELPVECLSCGLTLVSAPHLTRSYHHLFPVNNFKEVEFVGQALVCFACQKTFSKATDKQIYQCENCMQLYCSECDIFIHESLHTCVGCTTLPGVGNINFYIKNIHTNSNRFKK